MFHEEHNWWTLYRHCVGLIESMGSGCWLLCCNGSSAPSGGGRDSTSTSHNRSSLHIVQQTAAARPTSTCPTSVHQTQGLKTEKKYLWSCLLHVLMYECTIHAMCNNSMICPSFVFSHPNSEM